MADDDMEERDRGASLRRVGWHLPVLVMSVGVLGIADLSPAAAQDPAPLEVVIQGRGFGHGVGMSQEGALAMALAGASLEDILSTFYPGASLGSRSGMVRVQLLDSPSSSVVLTLPGGGQVRETRGGGDSPGFPVDVTAGGSVRISLDGQQVRLTPLDGASVAPRPHTASTPPPASSTSQASTTTTVPSLLGIIPLPPLGPAPPSTTTTVAPPPAPEWPSEPVSSSALVVVPHDGGSVGVSDLGRIYRGSIQARPSGGGLQLVNELDVEEYIRGMGEVQDPGWPAAALQAQAVAARTYALQAMAAGRALCSSQQCQVYLGRSAEYSAMNRAVAETAGQVLTYGGALAEAVYSANTGGVTATPQEGFGAPDGRHPYLVSASHPTNDPHPWELRLPLASVASRLGYPGQASGVAVTRLGPSGRPLEITFAGDAGPYAVTGHRFFTQLNLRSTLFTIRTEGGAQPAQPEGATIGVLPPGVPSVSGRRPVILEAGGAGSAPLGRAPWTALAVLLLAIWAAAYARSPYDRTPYERRRTSDRSKASEV